MTRIVVAIAALAFAAALCLGCEPDPNDTRECQLWYDTYKCKGAGDKCDEVAKQMAIDGKTLGGLCKDFGGKLACAPVTDATGACKAVESCTYETNDPLTCVADCTFIDGTIGADKTCAP